ncbi:MAG: universal stress protein [Verrucomicrobia bacterium]|nr:universal stress protein [Verrucomicrobiota bacterium]
MNPAQHTETRFKRILFCTDFSESADAAFDFAIDATIRRPGSTLYLLHVMHEADAQFWRSYLAEVDDVEEQSRLAITEKIRTAYLSRLPAGLEVKIEVRDGPDAPTILEFAASNSIDLIIIGRHGHGGVSKALFGGVAEKIVRKADCAVLVIPLSYAQKESAASSGAQSVET